MVNKYKGKLLRNTWVEINLDNIKNNLQQARTLLDKDTKIAAVLKANAYGHGTKYIAKTLIENGVDMLGVACLTEALEIRKDFGEIPILIMGYTPDEFLSIAVENNATLTIFTYEQGKKICEIAKELNKVAKAHIKIDTGFNRLGFKISEEGINHIEKITKLTNVEVEGIFSHLALVDEEIDENQFRLFKEVIATLEGKGVNIPIKHISDSIALVTYPQYQLDMVRPGAFIYGLGPAEYDSDKLGLKLALTFKTKVAQVKKIKKGEGISYGFNFVAQRDSIIGTLPVGYSDGYPRCLSNKGEVSIRGVKVPIVGRMCMDQLMIDITEVEGAEVGDEVVLLGESNGNSIAIMDVANAANTNRNEIISMIGRRVPRVYYKDSKVIDIIDYLLE